MAKIIKAAAQAVAKALDMTGLTAEQVSLVNMLPMEQRERMVSMLRSAVSDSKPRKAKSAEYLFVIWQEGAGENGRGAYVQVPRDKATHITKGNRKPVLIERVLEYAPIVATK